MKEDYFDIISEYFSTEEYCLSAKENQEDRAVQISCMQLQSSKQVQGYCVIKNVPVKIIQM